jgi:hypothetical protein
VSGLLSGFYSEARARIINCEQSGAWLLIFSQYYVTVKGKQFCLV